LKLAGVTQPEQAARFCTSSVPWLLAACNNVMLPIINFCSTNSSLPTKVSVAKVQLAEARARIWASLSEAADHQQIDAAVLQLDQSKIPSLNADTTTKAKLP
jgi:hypothetical protein